MENVILHLDKIDFHGSGTVGGVLYATIGGNPFPEPGWYDLVSADFEEWLPRLLSFAQCHTDLCVLRFMDGPCRIKLARSGNRVSAVCLWNQNVCIPETEIDFTAFLKSISGCIRMYSRTVYENGRKMPFTSELAILKNLLKN